MSDFDEGRKGTPTPDLRLPFPEAIAAFRKRLRIPSKDWRTVQGAENDWAFTVAGVTAADLLADFQAATERYIAQGQSFQEFSKSFTEIATRYGWQSGKGVAWRAETVARTNLRMSFAAGQYQQRQNPAVRKARPGLKWVHRDSPNFRPQHLAMDGRVFEAESVDWSLPSGYGCRCRFFTVPRPEEGYFSLSDSLPYTQPDGEQTQIPAIRADGKLYPVTDPGFYYLPGQSPTEARPQLLQQMVNRQPQGLRELVLKAIPARIKRKFALN